MRNFTFIYILFFSVQLAAASTLDSLLNKLSGPIQGAEKAELYNAIFNEYLNQDIRQEAFRYLQKAKILADELNDTKVNALTHFNMGVYYNSIDNSSLALLNFLLALKEYHGINDAKGEAATLMNIGIAYYSIKEYDEAINYYHKAIAVYSSLGNQYNVLTVRYLIANILREKKSYSESLQIFNSLIKTLNPVKDSQRLNECYINIGDIFLSIERYDSAEIYLDSAYIYFLSTNNIEGRSYAGSKLTQLYIICNEYQRAIDTANVCLQLAQTINARYLEVELVNHLAAANLALKNYEYAYQYKERYYLLKDSIFNAQNIRQYNALEKQLIEEQHHHELVLLNKARERQRLLTISIIGILLIFLITLIYRFVLKRKVNSKLKAANSELVIALKKLKEAQDELIRHEKMASLGKVTTSIAHEIQNPLNFINNFSALNNELIAELVTETDAKEFEKLLNDIKENNKTIQLHGQRAHAIVKGMLLESREGSQPKQPTDINKLVRDNYDMAYHAFKRTNPSFINNIKLRSQSLPMIMTESNTLGRVFLNLFDNALYALKKKSEIHPDFKPLIAITTKNLDDNIEIIIEDNGSGIPQKLIKDIFNPFITTKPPGEGTGLGLSICYDIIKNKLQGKIEVASEENNFTRFIIQIPVIKNKVAA